MKVNKPLDCQDDPHCRIPAPWGDDRGRPLYRSFLSAPSLTRTACICFGCFSPGRIFLNFRFSWELKPEFPLRTLARISHGAGHPLAIHFASEINPSAAPPSQCPSLRLSVFLSALFVLNSQARTAPPHLVLLFLKADDSLPERTQKKQTTNYPQTQLKKPKMEPSPFS